jgi:hypothetical protein
MTIWFPVMPYEISSKMLGWSCFINFKGHVVVEIWCDLDIHTSLTISIHRNINAIANIPNLNIPGKSSIEAQKTLSLKGNFML